MESEINESFAQKTKESILSPKILSLLKSFELKVANKWWFSLILLVYMFLCDLLLMFDPNVVFNKLDGPSLGFIKRF